MILLDTNVISELTRPVPALAVERWLAVQPPATVFLSTITEAELLYGLALMAPGRRRVALAAVTDAMLREDFAGRIIPFDRPAAAAFADIAAKRRREGRPISQADAQIAAIAKSCGAAIATRNDADFDGCGIEIVNPWAFV